MLSYKHNEYSYLDKTVSFPEHTKCQSYVHDHIILYYPQLTLLNNRLSIFLLCARMCSCSVIMQTVISMSTSSEKILLAIRTFQERLELQVLKLSMC